MAYPFLLELYQDYATQALSRQELLHVVRLVRATCSGGRYAPFPQTRLNKTFATFGRALKKDRYLESILAYFLLLPSYRRFPDDEEFKRDIQLKDSLQLPIRSTKSPKA